MTAKLNILIQTIDFSFYYIYILLFVLLQGLDFIYSQRGRPLLVVDNYLYRKNRGKYWRCIRCTKYKCRSRLILTEGNKAQVIEKHTHGPERDKIDWGRKVKTSMPKIFKASIDTMAVQLCTRQPHFDSEIIKAAEEDVDDEDDDDDCDGTTVVAAANVNDKDGATTDDGNGDRIQIIIRETE